MEIGTFLISLLPSVITGAIAFYIQRAQKQRDNETEARAKARKKESLLALDLMMANANLSYACAMALKRGSANGEVEEAIENYKEAKQAYYEFLNDQAKEHLQDS